ncbi:hypothetical protein MMC13_002786 [Lambiella insularis]|nr:hypothetical protein [Lambiella insularis]
MPSAAGDALTNPEPASQTSRNDLMSLAAEGRGTSHRSSSPSHPIQRAATTPLSLPSLSATTSPRTSREPSPTRPSLKPSHSTATRLARSRKNSQDLSPNRASNASGSITAGVPSAAAIQRALSAAGAPQLPPSAAPEFLTDAPRPQKTRVSAGGGALSRGAIPPRLKSPPLPASPNRSSIYSPRIPLTPSITVNRPTPTSASSLEGEAGDLENMPKSGARTPVKGSNGGTLETVQESSLPTTISNGMGTVVGAKQTAEKEVASTTEEDHLGHAPVKPQNLPTESGSESAGTRSGRSKSESKEGRAPSNCHNKSRPPNVSTKKSFSQLNSTKTKMITEGSAKNMTVETETVSSVPQVAVGGGAGERGVPGRTDTSGSIRLKPSTETIRPKKEKKKTSRKAPSIHSGTGGSFRCFHHHHKFSRAAPPESLSSEPATSPNLRFIPYQFHSSSGLEGNVRRGSVALSVGLDCSLHNLPSGPKSSNTVLTSFRGRTASSKADIFEAKVASAVDEANSSDSEETFVYESNPPEPLSARPYRYHSRTPSATSMASQLDQHGGRFRQDGHHSITGKKSMKFANNSLHGDSAENGRNGTLSGGRTSGGHVSHHHHIGRYGRANTGHTSLFDNESPFPNAGKALRTSVSNGSRLSPRPTTPRTPHVSRPPGNSKSNIPMLYDLEGEGADDERVPLIGSMRVGRNRNSRRPANRTENFNNGERTALCRKISGCIALGGVFGLLIAAIIIALVLCSKPLLEVHIREIQSVLASEQELMFDLHVRAINQNLVAIQITELSIDIFAKSKYVATDTWKGGRSPLRVDLTDGSARTLQGQKGHDPAFAPKRYRNRDGVDEGNDPIQDPEADPQLQLLGRILEFDSPLIFEASPLRHQSSSSIGEVRLARPGNQTQGLSDWWADVIQHPFELKVKGPLCYSLPTSSRVRKAVVSATILVQREDAIRERDDNVAERSRRARLP